VIVTVCVFVCVCKQDNSKTCLHIVYILSTTIKHPIPMGGSSLGLDKKVLTHPTAHTLILFD